MSQPKVFHTENAPAAVGPYSQACAMGNILYVSGQLGIDPASGAFAQGADKEGDFSAQARQALENLSAILKACGSDLNLVMSVDVFLTNMGRFKEFNAIYADFFSEHKPARAAIEVTGLPLGGMVEVKCVAAIKG